MKKIIISFIISFALFTFLNNSYALTTREEVESVKAMFESNLLTEIKRNKAVDGRIYHSSNIQEVPLYTIDYDSMEKDENGQLKNKLQFEPWMIEGTIEQIDPDTGAIDWEI